MAPKAFKFDLGIKVRDTITGFEGTVIGRAQYLGGCHRYSVQSATLKDGQPQDSVWFDEALLTLIKEAKAAVAAKGTATGGPGFDPPKR